MILEKKSFIIDYDENISYIPEVVNFLEIKMGEFMNYFELKSLKSKEKVIVFNSIEKYKKHLEKYTEYRDYMCADTYDGNINLLSLEEAHKTHEHANMTLDELKSTILHEFVHICQKNCQVEKYNKTVSWFWEALATNLGNLEKFSRITIFPLKRKMEDFITLEKSILTNMKILKQIHIKIRNF